MGQMELGGVAARLRIERASTVERVADALRDAIARGELAPGAQLREAPLIAALGVSRNTMREAFRLLGREGLVVHQLHRGVVVKRLAAGDVSDIFRTRRALEREGVRAGRAAPRERLAELDAAVADGERAAADGDWPAVASANIRFHRHVVGLIGGARVDAFFSAVLAELRLATAAMDLRELHESFVARNRELCALIAAGRVDEALAALEAYLADSERALTEAVAAG